MHFSTQTKGTKDESTLRWTLGGCGANSATEVTLGHAIRKKAHHEQKNLRLLSDSSFKGVKGTRKSSNTEGDASYADKSHIN